MQIEFENFDCIIKEIKLNNRRLIARIITKCQSDFNYLKKFSGYLKKVPVKTKRIGITGSFGVGKSTFISKLISAVPDKNLKIGIIAFDPKSSFTNGAILGDRIRMYEHFNNKNIFIRSISTNSSSITREVEIISKIFEIWGAELIFIETTGAGQTQTEISGISDIIVLLLQPGVGDEIQLMKAGIMEIADIIVITKGDILNTYTLKNAIISEYSLKSKPHDAPLIFEANYTNPECYTPILNSIMSLPILKSNLTRRRLKMLNWLLIKNFETKIIPFYLNKYQNEVNKKIDIYELSDRIISKIYKTISEEANQMIKKISHIGIATENIEKIKKNYESVLNLKLIKEEMINSHKVKVAMFKVGEQTIELLEPTSSDSPIQKFLEKRGSGIHHIAFEVDDIESSLKDLKNKEIKLIDETPRIGANNSQIAFIHPKSTGKVLIELCSHKKE